MRLVGLYISFMALCASADWKTAQEQMRSGQWSEAEQTLTKAVGEAPKHADYQLALGITFAHEEKWPEARAAFEATIKLDPNLPDAHFQLAEAALRGGDEQTALAEYTKAIRLAPAEAVLYASLADLYLRLNYNAEAEKTLTTGETRVTDEAKKFALFSLHGALLERRHDQAGASVKYETALKACGSCSESGQAIVYFNLGSSQAMESPPRRAEAIQNLQTFSKRICKGAQAARYADPCTQVLQLMVKLGNNP